MNLGLAQLAQGFVCTRGRKNSHSLSLLFLFQNATDSLDMLDATHVIDIGKAGIS